MKASKVVEKLQELIKEHGDLECMYYSREDDVFYDVDDIEKYLNPFSKVHIYDFA